MVHIMKPVGQGAFKISIRANFQGRTVTAAIAQTNYLTVAAANAAGAGAAAGAGRAAGGGISGVMIGAIAGAVAVGVGVAVAVSRAGGGAKTPSTPTGTIGAPGTPTIGPP
jgi:hypothetical protein